MKTMKLSDLLADKPLPYHVPDARSLIRKKLLESGKRIVVIDDDPTGGQTTHDVRVLMDWSVDTLRKTLAAGDPLFFISTNSRSLNPAEVKTVSLEVGRNLREAARIEGADIVLVSRSDSTLRGHFPYEIESLASGFGQ
ncbi:four-carbon acid sugar kinase family protein, partial [Chloroflexota bacterium]